MDAGAKVLDLSVVNIRSGNLRRAKPDVDDDVDNYVDGEVDDHEEKRKLLNSKILHHQHKDL